MIDLYGRESWIEIWQATRQGTSWEQVNEIAALVTIRVEQEVFDRLHEFFFSPAA